MLFGLPRKNRQKFKKPTRLHAHLLVFAIALLGTMNTLLVDASQEASSFLIQNQFDEESPEEIQENALGDESENEYHDTTENIPEDIPEGILEEVPEDTHKYIPEEATEENIIEEDMLMPEVTADEQSNPYSGIDLTLQQDGEGYTFDNNILTIHESGAYRLTGGTSEEPLSLSIRIQADASVELDNVALSSNAAMALAPDIETVLYCSGKNSLSSTSESGIAVPKGASLTIDGSGELTVRGGIGAVFSNPMGCAGIGSGVNMEGGTVIVKGGNISAYGGDHVESGGAGIGTGGSRGVGGAATLESIEIRGGTVFAQGGDSASGIGTGAGRNSGQTTIDNILISDGRVTCNAGRFAAEIGTGEAFSSGLTSVGAITITGGTITTTFSAEGGAAIGTGEAYNSGSNTIDLIRISGGDITAIGGPQGAGIGAGRGYNTNSVSRVERLEIKGGIIDAEGGTGGAGIGAGLAQNSGGISSVGSIIIDDGVLDLRGGLSAAGLGSGQGHSRGLSSVDSIVINGGDIQVQNDIPGYDGGAAIGSGEGSNNGQSNVGDVTIHNGIIYAAAGKGAAGIGAGEGFSSGISRVDSINIDGGTISHVSGGDSGAGIGAGLTTNSSGTSTVGIIHITGGIINAQGGELAPGIGNGTPSNWSVVDSLSIAGANVIAYAGTSASAIHLPAGELNIDSSANITAFALVQTAISQPMNNIGNGGIVNAAFTENEIDGDFYIQSTNLEIQFLLTYPYRYFAFSGLESQYNLVGGYTELERLRIEDITDPDNPLDYVRCDTDFTLRTLMAVGVVDGHFIEYRANGAKGDAPNDPNVYQNGESVTVLGGGGLYLEDLDFGGWNTKADGSGISYQDGDSFVIEQTVILYSQWRGGLAIASVPNISFGSNLLSGRDALYPAMSSDNMLIVNTPSSGWRLTASLGGFNDNFGGHAIPSGSVLLQGGTIESTDAGSPPTVLRIAEIDSGGGAVVIAQAAMDAGIGSWTVRWDSGDNSGISLFVPAGEGSAGSQTATITWSLEDIP